MFVTYECVYVYVLLRCRLTACRWRGCVGNVCDWMDSNCRINLVVPVWDVPLRRHRRAMGGVFFSVAAMCCGGTDNATGIGIFHISLLPSRRHDSTIGLLGGWDVGTGTERHLVPRHPVPNTPWPEKRKQKSRHPIVAAHGRGETRIQRQRAENHCSGERL